jgi:hypothetical protein
MFVICGSQKKRVKHDGSTEGWRKTSGTMNVVHAKKPQ